MVITVGFCLLSYSCKAFLAFQLKQPWMMWVALAAMLVAQIVLLCCGLVRTYPANFVLLLVFMLAMSYSVSFICSVTALADGGQVVLTAAGMTLAMVSALTLYASCTRTDFTALWGMAAVCGVVLLVLGVLTLFLHSPFLRTLYCAFGVIVFGFYLIIDTQMIYGDKSRGLSIDDYVLGALLLYIDIIQIFLYILELLSRRR